MTDGDGRDTTDEMNMMTDVDGIDTTKGMNMCRNNQGGSMFPGGGATEGELMGQATAIMD